MSVTHLPLNEESSELELGHFYKYRPERRPLAIPLKVNFLSSGKTAHVCTLDVSPSGARLDSAGHRFQPGDVILLQRRIEKARARVIWVGDESRGRGQVGIECLELDKVLCQEPKATRSQDRLFTPTFRLL